MAERRLSVITDEYAASGPAPASPERTFLSRPNWPQRLKWLLLVILGLWTADAGISLVIHYTALQAKLTARLAAAFGRPVEVRRYNFSLWTGPTLEAESVTVGEDPRFGNEYFLRAESVRVRLRWRSLLRGHIELGKLSLSQPSLNIVRSNDGDWNLAEWLPRPGLRGIVSPSGGAAALPFRQIEVEAGRVNFKQGDVKLPFALIGVGGTVQSDGPGRWRMDINATPWRASVVTQQAGSIHIAGRVGGTSSRLLPAVLDSSWREVSISDALRLMAGNDYGVRGSFTALLSARGDDTGWKLQGRAELRQLHRWDLPLRADNPALNLIAQMKVGTNASALEITDAILEAPHSNAHATANVSWSDSTRGRKNAVSPFVLELPDLNIDASDVVSWARAFHPGIADNISVQGAVTASASVDGWPPHFKSVSIVTDGAELTSPDLRSSVRLGGAQLDYGQDRISSLPLLVSFVPGNGSTVGSFRVEQITVPRAKNASWRLSGSMEQVRDLVSVAGLLGWNLSQGWDLGGPFRCDIRWQRIQWPWSGESTGSLDLGGLNDGDGASLRSAFMNRPIDQLKLRADWRPGSQRVSLSSAQAFGAHWSGVFNRGSANDPWQFTLAGDKLAASDVDLWLNPRWRESFIDRMLPFLNQRAIGKAAPENMHASGHLSLDQFILAPVALRRLQGDLSLNGRHLELTDASAQFYGGTVSGMFITDLKPVASYQVNADFARVGLSALGAASPAFTDLFSGLASGQVFFTAHGASRADIVSSLQCRGSADVDNPVIQKLNVADSLQDESVHTGANPFREASAAFTCGSGKIQFHDFALTGAGQEIDGMGTVDFGHNLDFRLNVVRKDSSAAMVAPGADTSIPRADSFQVSGPLSAPQIARVSSLPHRAR